MPRSVCGRASHTRAVRRRVRRLEFPLSMMCRLSPCVCARSCLPIGEASPAGGERLSRRRQGSTQDELQDQFLLANRIAEDRAATTIERRLSEMMQNKKEKAATDAAPAAAPDAAPAMATKAATEEAPPSTRRRFSLFGKGKPVSPPTAVQESDVEQPQASSRLGSMSSTLGNAARRGSVNNHALTGAMRF